MKFIVLFALFAVAAARPGKPELPKPPTEDKLQALLDQTRKTRELLNRPRPPIHAEQEIIGFDPAPVSSPLVQIIVNVQSQGSDSVGSPVIVVGDDQPSPVHVVEEATELDIVPTPVLVIDEAAEDIIPTPVQVVEHAEIEPTPVEVVDNAEIEPTPVEVVDNAEIEPTPVEVVDNAEIEPTPVDVVENEEEMVVASPSVMVPDVL